MGRRNKYYILRWKIFIRDDFTCQYCGQHAPNVPLEIDHKIAVVDGGTDEEDNLITSCWACNRGKEGLRQAMVRDEERRGRKPTYKLPRQNQILKLLADNPNGLTTTQIMEELNIKRGNADMAVARLKAKGEIKRNGDLLVIGVKSN